MTEKKAEMSDAMKEKLAPRKFVKNPINGTLSYGSQSSYVGTARRRQVASQQNPMSRGLPQLFAHLHV